MRHYVRWTEYNDHEGETWTLWLQRDGNETALEELSRRLAVEVTEENEEEFALDLDVVLNEHDVNVLVEHGGEGYAPYHTRVDGRLAVPPDLDRDDLYKRGVRDLFSASGDAGEADVDVGVDARRALTGRELLVWLRGHAEHLDLEVRLLVVGENDPLLTLVELDRFSSAEPWVISLVAEGLVVEGDDVR